MVEYREMSEKMLDNMEYMLEEDIQAFMALCRELPKPTNATGLLYYQSILKASMEYALKGIAAHVFGRCEMLMDRRINDQVKQAMSNGIPAEMIIQLGNAEEAEDRFTSRLVSLQREA